MHLMRSTIVLAALALGAFLSADRAPSPQEAPTTAPTLPAEYRWLAKAVGTWDAEIETFGQKLKGSEVCTMDLGGYWLNTRYEGQAFGDPAGKYLCQVYDSWDPAKKKYVGCMFDNSGTGLMVIESTLSADQKTMTGWSEGPDMTGTVVKWKHVTVLESDTKRTFTMTTIDKDGKETLFVKATYTKRK